MAATSGELELATLLVRLGLAAVLLALTALALTALARAHRRGLERVRRAEQRAAQASHVRVIPSQREA